jgi:rhodanese-related sulfurtransferase
VSAPRGESVDDVKPDDLPADKSATLVFYCGGEKCMACHKAAEMALELGYKNVNIMPAGISGWEKAKKKLEV